MAANNLLKRVKVKCDTYLIGGGSATLTIFFNLNDFMVNNISNSTSHKNVELRKPKKTPSLPFSLIN